MPDQIIRDAQAGAKRQSSTTCRRGAVFSGKNIFSKKTLKKKIPEKRGAN